MLAIRNPKTLFLKPYFTGLDARQAIAKCKLPGARDPGVPGTLLIFYLCNVIKIKRKQVFGITGRQRELKAAEGSLLVRLLFARLKKPNSCNHQVLQPSDHLGNPQLDLLQHVLVPRSPELHRQEGWIDGNKLQEGKRHGRGKEDCVRHDIGVTGKEETITAQ